MSPPSHCLALALLLCAALPAAAETFRAAVVVGHNTGSGDRPPLRFAEADAGKMAGVLVELGGVRPEDLLLLQGRGLAEVRQALDVAGTRVRRWHQDPSARVVLTFYFSGHSDGEALELGRERLRFSDLRAWLEGTDADVRVALVDSCRSGALLAPKGGVPGPAFDVRLTDELDSAGQVLLTSSAEDELALESRDIAGSFFTHHLVSGLRGAADASGDGRVTLAEAYQYAFDRTVRDTAGTLVGAQHPAYDFRLSGRGELVLTELARPRALLELPEGFRRALVVNVARDQVVAELVPGAARRIAVTPGTYALRLVRDDGTRTARIAVAEGQARAVSWDELTVAPAGAPLTSSKGGPLDTGSASVSPPTWNVLVGLGAQGSVAEELGALPALRVALRGTQPAGLSVAATVGTGSREGVSETSALGWFGYRRAWALGAATASAGLELGAGVLFQRLDASRGGWSGAGGAALWAGLQVPVTGPLSLMAEAQVPWVFYRRVGGQDVAVLPGAWVGLGLAR
ncbi:caspase family protein [Pyxidicoccus sp. MSG2]|uniref:caspase family protein n=1 Tax=Pyxidicoccus sp. MSG2 TaxID=2996790 RepID=UPI00226F29A2|nr:caspase family protein [Pyxidicoccus sp. MSG2]MCY1022756.1 caspase family protein [Pyxidicoccus sp. MSG2]